MLGRSIVLAASCSLFACSSEPPATLNGPDGGPIAVELDGATHDAAFDTVQDTKIDCRVAQKDGTVCACAELGQKAPTLYLLLDRSGSMGETIPGTSRSKWSLVRSALVDEKIGALRPLGGRIHVAMAWFPSPSSEDACNAGRQVFGPERGTPDVYSALEAKLASAMPRGATPTAASLDAVVEKIAAMPQPAHVLLATDGAPNCGAGPCDANACTYNIENDQLTFTGKCDATLNCCDPATTTKGLGWKACVDLDATLKSIERLRALGSKVFVLGVPGTADAYARVLNEMATAGGAARDGDTKYYRANEPTQESLAAALSTIAGKVVDTCELRLEEPVVDPGVTNVLLDGEAIAEDDTDGWRWTSPSSISLVGAACDRVLAGKVARVQVVVGCRTVTK